ncbi:Chemotaxis protein [Lentibacillus sp. JNUCC-1]|uniref:chemotaxis protein CheW n=1 Tax=Lentibacillus sp. JNUCC-1 TaxID=2654513 RepID=UPI0012E73FB7|nr:chemotaxis protein CheW [Lentibacillus sp. JNUCC-1]MUV39939.1 Chemotaxis protein [Lentibacillus sp. JNUCC-1]
MSKEEMGFRKSIVFQLGNDYYTLPVEQIGLIERMQPITRVPGTAAFVKGVINLRGVVTPVIDLRERFGIEPKAADDATRIIIVHWDEMEVGLLVDKASDVMDIPEADIEPPPELVGTVDIDYIEGVAKVDSRLLILLDLSKVLTKDNFHAHASER